MNRFRITAFALLVLTCLSHPAQAISLVRDGKPAAVIVLPASPTPEERQCAAVIQKYIKLMSNAELPIGSRTNQDDAILIGKQEETLKAVGSLINDQTLGFDGIIIKDLGKSLIVVGNKGSGQIYAGFELLKRLGCRFYLPHPDGEVVPHQSTISLEGINVVHKPNFIHRVFWASYAPHNMHHPDWYKSWETKVYQGGLALNHGHNYEYVVSPRKYFAAHPEYFSLVREDGKLVRSDHDQLCLSHPDLPKIFADAACAAFQGDPKLRAYSLSPNDFGRWCECDKCKAMDVPEKEGGVSTRVLAFNNKVAELVAPKFPDHWLTYYADYSNVGPPPINMKAHPMILPGIVNTTELMHDLRDPGLQARSKKAYARVGRVIQRVRAYEQIAGKMFVYEWYQFDEAPQMPTPTLYAVGSRIRYYSAHNVLAYSGEMIGRSPVNDITVYLACQLLWDSSQKPGEIIDEFYQLYFAECAQSMNDYYLMLHDISTFSTNSGYVAPTKDWTPAFFAKLGTKLTEAEKLAKQDVVKRRLGRERKCLIALSLAAAPYRFAEEWTSKGDKAARTQAIQMTDQAINYLRGIAGQDIVCQNVMIGYLEKLRAKLK